jgi:entericidin B
MKRLAYGFLFLTIAALSACNTVEGAGKDVQEAGEEVQEAAKGE